jgi:5'-nucleotidase
MASSRITRRLAAVAAATALALGFTALTATATQAAIPTHTIADVQGDTDVSPLSGAPVTIEGVVTGDYRASTASGYRGFFIQDPAGDPTDARSDGIFIFSASADPAIAIGDRITVTGTVSEFNGQTQVSATDPAAYEVIAAAEGVPAPVTLPDSVVGAGREAFEGMLVKPESAHLSSSHQLFNFGTLWLNVGPSLAVKATETTDAGPDALAIAAANRANRLLVDDGYSIQVGNAAHPGNQPFFETGTTVRNGDGFISPAAGMILSWGFSDWRLQPQRPLSDTSPAEFATYEPIWEPLNPRTDSPADVGGDFSVGAFNVFNYFTTFGGDARGADGPEAFAVQQSKIVAAINALDADIVALMEIENSVKLGEPADEALANLVDALNAASAPGTWAFVPTPAALLDAATTDFITNAIIYKPAVATPVGDSFADTDETVWDIAREPIAQTFEVDGKVLTVVANHLKSKSAPSSPAPPEPEDLQGFFNAERVEQTTRLLTFVDTITANAEKGPDVILLGDFNSYHEEDPSQKLTDAGFVDLVPPTGEYTYTFDGELGSLDHAYASPSLAASVTGTDVWTINSPEWSDRGYEFGATEPGTPFRSSDHDPIKVGLSSALPPVTIDLLSINDFHGRIEAAPPIAGAAVLGGMVNAYRAANPNTLFVGAGDLIGASTFTSFIQQDVPTIEALNEIGLDTSSYGNHEFDQGREDVDGRIAHLADWDYLAANLYEKGTQTPAFPEYWVQDFGDVSVGFVGAVTEELPSLVSPAGIATLDVGPVVPAVNRVADQLSDDNAANGEADVIVLLVHEGAATPDISSATDDSPFGRIVNGANANIDAIISGHTHLAYDHEIPVPGTEKIRPVISSGQYGEKYSHTTIAIDPQTGELVSIAADVLPLANAFPPDPEVAQIVADAVEVAKELGSVKVGDITADLNRARQADGTTENRGGESTLGNFVADVQLWATQDNGAEIAFMNPGGLRSDLKYAANPTTLGDGTGVVTYSEAAGVQSFANTLVTLDMTGAQIREVLEQQWQPAGASRPFLKLGVSSNFVYTYDPLAAPGARITGIQVNGEPIDPAGTYTVTVNSFLASGGDNFFTFAQGTNRADSGKVDLASMVDYFEANPVVDPDYKQRAVGVSVSAPDADGYSAGDPLTLTLSSLLFTIDGPRAGTAVVSAGGVELGSSAIDPAVVNTTDEVGRATVPIVIPEGTPGGPFVLTVSVPETGTTVDVTIEVTSSAEPITNVAPPAITGQPRVGRTLTTDGGSWSVEDPALAYQWNRNGTAIEGATAASYTLVAADAGAEITVTVTASKEGFDNGTATSAGLDVRKLSSTTSGSASRLLVFGNQALTYTVTVRGQDGLVPTGEVAIYDGTRKLTTVQLEADDNGRVTVPITGLSSGIHLLTARYGGNDQLTASVGWPSIVIKF